MLPKTAPGKEVDYDDAAGFYNINMKFSGITWQDKSRNFPQEAQDKLKSQLKNAEIYLIKSKNHCGCQKLL